MLLLSSNWGVISERLSEVRTFGIIISKKMDIDSSSYIWSKSFENLKQNFLLLVKTWKFKHFTVRIL